MRRKDVMAEITKARKTNEKNAWLKAGGASIIALLAAGGGYLASNHKSNKLKDEINNLDNKMNSVVATIAEATTKPTESDADAKRNKFMIVNMFVMADAIDRKADLYTKKSSAVIDKTTGNVTTEAVYEKLNDPKLSDFDTSDIYMTESDYDKMYNTTEDKK